MSEVLWNRSRALLEPGDLIQPGNWGRTVLGFGTAHNFYLREYVIENIRAREYPDKPSRLKSSFAYVAEGCAMRSFQDHGLYRVEVVDESQVIHRGDFGWIDLMPGLRTFSDLEDGARRYWDGTAANAQSDSFEVVSESQLRIVERIPTPSEQLVDQLRQTFGRQTI